MPFYRCFIRGEHFPGECIGRRGLYGFYTTRWLQALNEHHAEIKAVEILRKDTSFALPAGVPKSPDTKVYVEEIERIARLPRFRGKGATWFAQDE